MSFKKETIVNLFALLLILLYSVACISCGYMYRKLQLPNAIHVSQTALWEMNLACSGNYRDLAVNRKYVYANCVAPGKPVTIQNYEFK